MPRTNVYISHEIVNKDLLEKVREKAQEIAEDISDIAQEGTVNVFVFSRKEKFSPLGKLVADLAVIKKIYQSEAFMSNPSLAQEFSEIGEHIKEIVKIIDKRKKIHKEKVKKRIQKKERQESENEKTDGGGND